jgi:signal transduction histidine kinase
MTNNRPLINNPEIGSLRQNLNLIRSQVKAGRIDEAFLNRQIDKMNEILDRYAADQQQRKRAEQFEALYNVSRVLGSSLDLQVVLDQVMDAIIQLTGAERGFLMLRDDDGGLEVKAARNLDQKTLIDEEFKYSRTVANQVLDSGGAILTTNAAEDPRFAQQASVVAQSLRSVMATPLRARGTVIGVIYVDNRAFAGLFREEDLAALDALSSQAAVALDNALLFNATDKELARRVEELQQLRRIDLLLNETLDADKAMAHTLEWVCRLSGATAGHLGFLEGDPAHVRAVQHYGRAGEDGLPEYLDVAYPPVKQVIASGRPVMRDWGRYGVGTLLAVPILREQKVIGVVVMIRDDTHPFTEEQHDLIARIIARSAVAIENGQLYARVQAADRAKSEFVGIVAHDLKTPMTSIAGYAELMMMQGGLTERQFDYLSTIRDTVRRMEVLVSDLADISRIESGHFFMDETRVSVPALMQAVRDGTQPQIEARRHSFSEEIDDDLPEVWGDYYRLLQVLTNLVSNAYKYTPDGGSITLSARREGDGVVFSVRDTGIGLSPEAIAKLGTKFWRADDTFTRSQPGTGLGFAITRSLVEQMGSRIQIESEVGRGSRFTFSVRLAPPAEDAS